MKELFDERFLTILTFADLNTAKPIPSKALLIRGTTISFSFSLNVSVSIIIGVAFKENLLRKENNLASN